MEVLEKYFQSKHAISLLVLFKYICFNEKNILLDLDYGF